MRMRSHPESLAMLHERPLHDVITVTGHVSGRLNAPIYPASRIVIEGISCDGGVAAQVRMTYDGVVVKCDDETWPTLAQVLAFVMDKHW